MSKAATTQEQLGANARAELVRRAERRIALLDQIAEQQEEIKAFKAEDKADGYTEKAIAQAIKLKRADPEALEAFLLLRAETDLYLEALGLPVDLEAAQALVRESASELPEGDDDEAL